MATATPKESVIRQAARQAGKAAVSPPAIEFAVFADNAGEYRWSILDSAGEILAQSRTFKTHDAAQHAADRIRAGLTPEAVR